MTNERNFKVQASDVETASPDPQKAYEVAPRVWQIATKPQCIRVRVEAAAFEVKGRMSSARCRDRLDWSETGDVDLHVAARARISRSQTLADAAQCLFELLTGGYGVWDDGTLYYVRVLVARVAGLKIVIHTREHGPAHFHVVAGDLNASFSIDTCTLIAGEISGRDRQLVEYWHAAARPLLVKVWNETRPSDCPVGPLTP